jgi:HD-like signal output (HDOD) protein
MSNLSLAETIRGMVDANKVRLPVYPEVADAALAVLAEQPVKMDALCAVINRDPSLVCNLLRAANSTFYKGLNKTVAVNEAVTRLGLERASEVVEQVCRQGDDYLDGEFFPLYLTPAWQHALGCALGARWLADRCGYQGLADQAYLAGLMHDIGKLFLLATLEKVSAGNEFETTISNHLVDEIIDTMHIEQGLRLVEDWNLPELYALVIRSHHEEDLDTQDIVVALVKLANKGCIKAGLGLKADPGLVLPTTAEAQFLGINEIALAEYEIMLEDHFQLVETTPLC